MNYGFVMIGDDIWFQGYKLCTVDPSMPATTKEELRQHIDPVDDDASRKARRNEVEKLRQQRCVQSSRRMLFRRLDR